MANTYKNIVITPNISSNTADPKVVYSGGNTTANTDITLYVYPDSNGSLSWEGSAGQLFSITNDLSNNLFGVNDVSGIPYIEVYANGLVSVAQYGGNVVVGNTAEFILSSGTGLYANGSLGTAGQILTSNASSVYWRPPVINTTAVTLTSQSTVEFTGIPSWVKRITLAFRGVSTSGSSPIIVQLGTSASFTTTGYLSSVLNSGGSGTQSNNTITNGLAVDSGGAGSLGGTTIRHGTMTILNIDGNNWVSSSIIGLTQTNIVQASGCSIALSDTLTRLRLNTFGGTETFDAGSVNILYE